MSDACVSEGDGARILSLAGRARQQRAACLTEVRSYWEALCPAPGVVPPRLAIRPQAIESALHATLVLERNAPGVMRFRIAGRDVVAAMGTEPRGLPLTALFEIEAKARALHLAERVFLTPSVVEMALIAELPEGPVGATLLLLPLTDYIGQVSMALGVLAFDAEPPGGRPCRFRVTGQRVSDLPPLRVTQPGCFALDGIEAAAEAPAAPGPARLTLVASRD